MRIRRNAFPPTLTSVLSVWMPSSFCSPRPFQIAWWKILKLLEIVQKMRGWEWQREMDKKKRILVKERWRDSILSHLYISPFYSLKGGRDVGQEWIGETRRWCQLSTIILQDEWVEDEQSMVLFLMLQATTSLNLQSQNKMMVAKASQPLGSQAPYVSGLFPGAVYNCYVVQKNQ